jgi:hypothetical protein
MGHAQFCHVSKLCVLPHSQRSGFVDNMSSTVELYVRPSALLLIVPPVSMPRLRVGTDEWLPWPMTRPKVSAHTDEIMAARARLDVVVRDMVKLQQKLRTACIDESYLQASHSLHNRYQDWMSSLEPRLQTCEIASQQHILLQ